MCDGDDDDDDDGDGDGGDGGGDADGDGGGGGGGTYGGGDDRGMARSASSTAAHNNCLVRLVLGSANSRQKRSVSCRLVSAWDIWFAVGRCCGEMSIIAESRRNKLCSQTPRWFILGSLTVLIVAPNAYRKFLCLLPWHLFVFSLTTVNLRVFTSSKR